ncbi:MAG: SAM-dependent methyltransferase, partial [Clostridiales bacterium]|nr:SAM-dependent methyltransferase [Clostridiales bacterium]
MWIADNWKDYEVVDTSEGEKLERWGEYILVRPDPQVIWNTAKKHQGWKNMNGHYHRSDKGGGEWEFFNLPKQWEISYKDLRFNLQPFSFKHTGLFPEQAVNWDWFSEKIGAVKGEQVKVLNLFAYTGGATLAAAKAGAVVTHVDASKGMVTWAKENAIASGLGDAPIRYLVDDCVKFVEREIRRGNKYDAVIM